MTKRAQNWGGEDKARYNSSQMLTTTAFVKNNLAYVLKIKQRVGSIPQLATNAKSPRYPACSSQFKKIIRRVGHSLAISIILSSISTANAKLRSLDNLFVFGDSSSDIGNSTILTLNYSGTTSFPAPPNFEGRASNGFLAHEYLWALFNPASPGIVPSFSGGTNYAISGATTGKVNFNIISPLVPDKLKPAFVDHGSSFQLKSFLDDHPSFDPNTSLFYIWAFPNDVLHWLISAQMSAGNGLDSGTVSGLNPNIIGSDANSVSALIKNGVENVATMITALANQGATQFLIPNMADLGMTPLFGTHPDPTLAPKMSQISLLYNDALANTLQGLQHNLLGVEIMQANVDRLLSGVFLNPGAYGFESVTNSCLDTITGNICQNPDSWLFWDYFHPTTAVQRAVGHEFYNIVYDYPAPIPVPAPAPIAALCIAYKFSRVLRKKQKISK